MRYLVFTALLVFLGYSWAQPQRGGKGPGAEKKGEIFGSVKDSISGKPVDYVTVLALKQPGDKAVGGTVTAENGSFSIADLPYGKYTLKLTFVGFKSKLIEGITLTPDAVTYNTKNIELAPTVLNTVEVVGGQPDITYEIDKKVVNVEDQLNTDGQTAVEILENIPSVSVSADGTVSLRGSSSFTLLIDGIPTIMNASDALATIPAGSIKDIEIITNPSAKFDAEGTSGVINIITKKNKLEGISCLVNLNAGRFENYGGDIAVNIKKSKFVIDLSANYNQRGRPNETTVERVSTYDSLVNTLKSVGESNWKRSNWGFGGGVQWKPNNSHTFAVRSRLTSNLMQPYSDYFYQSFNDDSLISEFYTDQHNHIDFVNTTSNLFYQYNIRRNQDHYISFKAIANVTSVEQNDTTLSYGTDQVITSGNLYTETGPANSYRFNVDYSLPLKKSRKFEAGLQSQFGQSGDIGKNYVYNVGTGVYDFNPLFSSDVDYIRNVHAAYSMFGGKLKEKIGYQLGLRAEYTYRTIASTAEVDFTEINRLDWFPSAHFSYGFDNKSQVLASYSRRIERPRSYFFEPFITWESPFNVRSGNPNLQPQYINAFEVSFMQPLSRKGFYSIEGYFRKSTNIIERISSVYDEGILLSQPYNIGTSQSFGTELGLSYNLFDWWKVNTGLNFYMFNLEGELNDVDYSRQSFNWSGRVTNTFTYEGWMLQLVSRYNSASVTAQGESLDSFRQDVTLKKSFMKKRLSVSLQGRNILGTARRASTSITENVYINSVSKPLAPQLMLTVSIKLNNYQKAFERSEQMDDF